MLPTQLPNQLLYPLLIASVGLMGCNQDAPSSPMCRVSAEASQAQTPQNAACVIRIGTKLLTITHSLSGKLDLPGGSAQAQESPQCTAHRETWEETGFNVEVGELLQQSESGFQFYACYADQAFSGELQEFPVLDWFNPEVQSVQLIDPFITEPRAWRYQDELVLIRNAFVALPKPPKSPQ